MNRLSEIASTLEANVEEYIRTLDEYARLKSEALAFLKSLRGGNQTELQLPIAKFPVIPTRENGLTMTQIVESAVRSLNKLPSITVLDVKDVLKKAGTTITDDQIGTAFRKLVSRSRPPSPLEKIREGRGNIPPIYRLKSSMSANGHSE